MTWVLAILLAVAAWLVIVFAFKTSRKGWEAIAAALLLGIAGYGMQASPGMPGAPKTATQEFDGDPAALVEARQAVADRGIPSLNRWIVIADGMARNGQFANAAQVLLGAIQKDPDNSEAWLALANALLAHADGNLTPASLYAYQRAELADPDSPGPPLFLGLALAQSGRLVGARTLWSDLLERSPPDAPWRQGLAERLEQVDQMIAAQQGGQIQR